MRNPLRLAVVAAFSSVLIVSLMFVARGGSQTEASHAGGMDAMSVDVDITGNTATSLGPLESCVEARPGDTVTVDVTATNIPAATAMIGFAFEIQYDDVHLAISADDHQFLLAANQGSILFNVSDATPDANPDGLWRAGVADLSVTAPESGSGVLSRLSIGVDAGAPPGLYSLRLRGDDTAAHVDRTNQPYFPDRLNHGVIAVGLPCPEQTPGPSPTPTSSPSSTPVVTPGIVSAVTFDPFVVLSGNGRFARVEGSVICSERIQLDLDVVIQDASKQVAVGHNVIECQGITTWSVKTEVLFERLRPGDADILVELPQHGVGASGAVQLMLRGNQHSPAGP